MTAAGSRSRASSHAAHLLAVARRPARGCSRSARASRAADGRRRRSSRASRLVAMDGVRRERRQADRDVLGAARASSSAPTRPPRRARPGRRARRARPPSCSTCSAPSSTTVYSSNSGRWPGSTQPAGRAHARDAQPLLAGVDAADVLVDQLRLGARRLDARGGLDQLRHRRSPSRGEFRPGSGSLGPMSATDDLLGNNEAYAASFDKGDLPMPPAKKVAVVACMDARLDPAPSSASRRATRTSSATPAAWSPTTRSARWRSPSACSAPRRSSSSTTPTAAC